MEFECGRKTKKCSGKAKIMLRTGELCCFECLEYGERKDISDILD